MAVYTKVHHAAIDGVSGNDILAAVLDLSPEGRELGDVPDWQGDKVPGPVPLLARSVLSPTSHPGRAARLTVGVARSAPGLLRSPSRPAIPVLDKVLLRRGASTVLSQTGLRAPRTPFNKPVTPHRRWAFRTVALADVKAVKSASGATVNDVVMALCSGALRRWLQDHDALPDGPLVAAVPVSVRTGEQKGTGGNRVSTMITPIPTNVEDPAERLALCHGAMRAAKEQHGALPANLLGDVTQFAMPALAGQAARLAARLRLVEWLNPFNLIISNVPGPNVPLYYAGARLLAYYPLSAIADGQGPNITVMSFEDGMHFGLIACRELVPDLDRMAGYLVDELADLTKAVVRP
ncbi:MAG: wax ester synthase/diacylglycerol acyltransferase [Frankiales bacterium]|nr:wax ester synthase/diacylglycerol acyltransferase [Frankiales bacterium]